MQSMKTVEEILLDLDLGKVDIVLKNIVNALTKSWYVELRDWQYDLEVIEHGDTPMTALAMAVFRLNLKRDKLNLPLFSPVADNYIVQ